MGLQNRAGSVRISPGLLVDLLAVVGLGRVAIWKTEQVLSESDPDTHASSAPAPYLDGRTSRRSRRSAGPILLWRRSAGPAHLQGKQKHAGVFTRCSNMLTTGGSEKTAGEQEGRRFWFCSPGSSRAADRAEKEPSSSDEARAPAGVLSELRLLRAEKLHLSYRLMLI